jgi:hypothetical protein
MTITGEVIQSVFHIQTVLGYGSAFTVVVDGRQYFVTARHLFSDQELLTAPGDFLFLEIFHGMKWNTVQCTVVGFGQDGNDVNDIAILALPFILTEYDLLVLGTQSLSLGQDVFFLGYPLARRGDVGQMNNNYPLPYVKKAIVSMINFQTQHLVLDGINNAGFSGGPVVYRQVSGIDGRWHVAGVVTSREETREPVFHQKSENEAPYCVFQDSGLINCCPILIGLTIIKANPIGKPMPTNVGSNIQ